MRNDREQTTDVGGQTLEFYFRLQRFVLSMLVVMSLAGLIGLIWLSLCFANFLKTVPQ